MPIQKASAVPRTGTEGQDAIMMNPGVMGSMMMRNQNFTGLMMMAAPNITGSINLTTTIGNALASQIKISSKPSC